MIKHTTPYRECPRYEKCSVNNCPLHPQYPNLIVDLEDKEPKCTMEKRVRFRIGSKYPDILKFQGLTPSEWAGKQRFDNMTEEQRQIIRERAKSLKVSAFQSHHSKIGTNLHLTNIEEAI